MLTQHRLRTVEFVWSQILQGIGGGFVVVSAQVGGQASVAHADIAMATAFILLFAWVGGAVGSAIGTLSGLPILLQRF